MAGRKAIKNAKSARKRLYRLTVHPLSVYFRLFFVGLLCTFTLCLFFNQPRFPLWLVGGIFFVYGLLPLIGSLRMIPLIGQTVIEMNETRLRVLDECIPWDTIVSVEQTRNRLDVLLENGSRVCVSDAVMGSDVQTVHHQLQLRIA